MIEELSYSFLYQLCISRDCSMKKLDILYETTEKKRKIFPRTTKKYRDYYVLTCVNMLITNSPLLLHSNVSIVRKKHSKDRQDITTY